MPMLLPIQWVCASKSRFYIHSLANLFRVHCIVEIELIVRLELIVLQKGFPTDQTLDDLLEYFDEFGGESVSLRRDAKRLFKVCFYIKVCNLQIMFNFII